MSGFTMDADLSGKLVDNLRTVPVKTPRGPITILGEFVEPLHLQVVCQNLVSQLKSGASAITKDQVSTFADVDQALSEFYQRALAITARETNVAEAKIRRWFDEELITAAGTRAIVFQGETETAGLPNQAASVLARQNVIRGELRAGALWYELIHDRFIEPIRKSNGRWREERGEAYRIAQRLEVTAANWDRMGKPVENLLNEAELEEARRWVGSPEAAEAGYGDKLQALITASAAELEQKRERQRLLEEQARSARRFRNLSILSAALCVLALITVAWGYREQLRLKSVRLAAAAMSQLNISSDHSVLLAMHAVKASPTTQAINALRRALHELRLERTLIGHSDKVIVVAFSPKGDLLASGGEDQTARIWDAGTWSPLQTIRVGSDRLLAVAFSPDGRRLLTASNGAADDKNSGLQIWDARKGQLLIKLPRPTWISAAAYHPTEPVIASVEGANGVIHLWWDMGSELREVGHWEAGGGVNAMAFSLSGGALATGGRDKLVEVWPVQTCMGNPKCTPFLTLKGNRDKVMGIAFSRDGKYVASAGMDLTVHIWNAKGDVLHTLPNGHVNTVFSVDFDRQGRLVTAGADARVKVWDPFSGRELLNMAGHTGPVDRAVFSPDGTHLATASWDHTVKVWNIGGHTGFITELAFSPDGRYLATSSYDKTVKLWDATTMREIETLPALDDTVSMVTFNHDGTMLGATTNDGKAHILDVASRQWSWQMGGNHVLFNPRAPEVVTDTEGGGIWLWELKEGVKPRKLGQSWSISGLAFSPDGKWVASAASDQPPQIWDVSSTSGKPHCSLQTNRDYITTLAFSPDSGSLATGSVGGTLRVWDVIKCSALPTSFRGHGNAISELAFSPNGKELATSSWDKTARIWDVATGKEKVSFDLDTSVNGIAFSHNGQRIALATESVIPWIYLRDQNSGNEMEQARKLMQKLGTTLQPDECNRYFDSRTCPPMP